jgi:bifunctional non-homologous end joining protein LigD
LPALFRGKRSWTAEIVHLDSDGKPLFYDLMRRRSPQHFYAFELLWLNGRDLRELPLVERKRLLRTLVLLPSSLR